MPERATSIDAEELAGLIGDWAGGTGPLFRQLSRAIAGAVERGALVRGVRLPSERVLADTVAVSRGTAVAAYDLLVGEGMIERRPGSGTYVIHDQVPSLPEGREGSSLVHRLVDRSAHSSSVVDLSLSVLHGMPDLPDARVTTADLLGVVPDTGYSPWGLAGLRAEIADHVTDWGLPTHADEVVVTTGAQQAISAAAACWVRPGDVVIVDDPTYPGALAAFRQAGAVVQGVAVDRFGMRTEDLRRALAGRPALVYVQSTLHSPTGTVLSEHRRRDIAALITSSRVPLLEDMSLADLAWHEAPPPIASFCGDASVAVVGSLSKLFWGGLRVGFARAAEPLALRFARVKATTDLGSSAVSQVMAERWLHAAKRSTFVADRRAELRRRYNVLAHGLAMQLPGWTWREPEGGLSIWVRIPGEADAYAQTALREGVAVATAGPLSPSRDYSNHLRLSFSAEPEVLSEGVARLARAWRASAARTPRPASPATS
jgi:DNA-binding transcriptional MocR family regulator